MREPRPITRIELSEKNKGLRLIAAIALLVIGVIGITVGFMHALNRDDGWQRVQVVTQERSCTENFVLQSLWMLFCFGWITVQFLCCAAGGTYLSLFVPGENLPAVSAVLGMAASNLPFIICMLVPVVLQFTLQAMSLLRRRSLLGKLLGGDWMELLGMLLLALILSFTSFTLAMRDDADAPSPRHLLEIEYNPALSAETFGVLPQTALDLKFNVLHIAKDEVIKHYIVTGDGAQVEVTEREAASWLQEG